MDTRFLKRRFYSHRRSNRLEKLLPFRSIFLVCLIFLLTSSSDAFFFPKSLFRKSSSTESSGSGYPPSVGFQGQPNPRLVGSNPQQQGRGGQLQSDGSNVQPTILKVSRPYPAPPHAYQDQLQVATSSGNEPPPGSQFHVPRELCLACEKFPWMPVAGAVAATSGQAQPGPTGVAASAHVSTFTQAKSPYGNPSQNTQPTKTIVINALGEAQGPVPLPPVIPSRRPFALQFDENNAPGKNESNNSIFQEPAGKPQLQHEPQLTGFSKPSAENHQQSSRPVMFQIYQTQSPNPDTLIQQSLTNAESFGMEPPQEYGQPTILHPQNVPPAKQQLTQIPDKQQSNGQTRNNVNLPFPNPLAVGTIVAQQQNGIGVGGPPPFQKIQPANLVYHEHFTSPQQQYISAPQNFKVPIISQQSNNIPDMKPPPPLNGFFQIGNGNNGIPRHPQHGPSPLLQMRPQPPYNLPPPPRPAVNMMPPGPMIFHQVKPVPAPNNFMGQQLPPPADLYFQPPPQNLLHMGPPPPPSQHQQQFGQNRPPQDEQREPSENNLSLQLLSSNSNSIGNSVQSTVPIQAPTPNYDHNSPSPPPTAEPTFTQETGWEIIPSIQTDLTHLFTPDKDKINTSGSNNIGPLDTQKELPVPVPVPVPNSHPPQASLFILEGQHPQQQQHQDNTRIKVQDVTYHEEAHHPQNSDHQSKNTVSQFRPVENNLSPSSSSEHQVQTQPQNGNPQLGPPPQIQFIRPRPFILGLPNNPPQMRPFVYAPQPFQPAMAPQLPPSVMTDLNHAQQTSLLTHHYLSQTNYGGDVQQPLRENTISVRPVVSAILNQVGTSGGSGGSNVTPEGSSQDSQARFPHNCQNLLHQQQQQPIRYDEAQQQVQQQIQEPDVDGNPEENTKQETESEGSEASRPDSQVTEQQQPSSQQVVRGSVNLQDGGNKGSYFLYYPRAVSKPPIVWVQPSRTATQGVVRLSPQMSPPSPPIASSIVAWSRPRVVVANQFRTDHRVITPNKSNDDGQTGQGSFKHEEVHGDSNTRPGQQHSSSESEQDQSTSPYEENIPYGQKLGIGRERNEVRTPFDIITVSGGVSDEVHQSVEESSENSGSENQSHSKETNTDLNFNNDPQEIGETTGTTGDYKENEGNDGSYNPGSSNDNNFDTNDDTDDERDYYGPRQPALSTTFRKPISTTVIHSPQASSFQSLKLPNFKPHRVIVHDFTSHSGSAAVSGPSPQESPSEPAPSHQSLWEGGNGKIKAAKYVENDDEDEGSSAESINRPQGLNIPEVIASGSVNNADCLTVTHADHSLASVSSTMSPRVKAVLSGESLSPSSKGREIHLPIGSRFPGGRPPITSLASRPGLPLFASPATNYLTTTTTETASARPGDSSSHNERNFAGHGTGGNGNGNGFAASIPVPVYRRPISITYDPPEHIGQQDGEESRNQQNSSVIYIRPQTNVLVAEDIYTANEMKEEKNANRNGNSDNNINPSFFLESTTLTGFPATEGQTTDPAFSDLIMSTEKSSSFSVSLGEIGNRKKSVSSSSSKSSSSTSSWGYSSISQNEMKEPVEGNEVRGGAGTEGKSKKVKVVQVTSVPVTTEAEPTNPSLSNSDSSTTTIPSPASTSTKIVKTVRVRQRMRSGSFNGPLRNRFHGPGRVRVIHRPASQDYIRRFPEFATQDGDKLAKEEEQEVKNALIELKKSAESIKT